MHSMTFIHASNGDAPRSDFWLADFVDVFRATDRSTLCTQPTALCCRRDQPFYVVGATDRPTYFPRPPPYVLRRQTCLRASPSMPARVTIHACALLSPLHIPPLFPLPSPICLSTSPSSQSHRFAFRVERLGRPFRTVSRATLIGRVVETRQPAFSRLGCSPFQGLSQELIGLLLQGWGRRASGEEMRVGGDAPPPFRARQPFPRATRPS